MNRERRVRVSVVMAVYNGGSLLHRAVDGVLSQTFGDFEFVIVDDGSTDGTSDYLSDLARQDERMHVIHQTNRGLTRSLIVGCEAARGEYIARQDADDESLPERLARQVALLDASPQAVLATCWVDDVSADGLWLARQETLNHFVYDQHATEMHMVGIPAHGSVIFRRDAYLRAGGYQACFYYAQDCDLWLRLHECGEFVVIPEVLYRRTADLAGISDCFRQYQARFAELGQECFRARLSGHSEIPWLDEAAELAKKARRNRGGKASARDSATSLMLLAARVAENNPRLARQYYWRALRICPYHLRTWKNLLCHVWQRPRKPHASGMKS